MTKPAVVIPTPPDAPGILHVEATGKFGPAPTHDVGHEQRESPNRNERADTIRQLAYALWEARGRPHGSSQVDWLGAEREVSGRLGDSSGREATGMVSDGPGLTRDPGTGVKEDDLTNPHDGRGPLRTSDDLGYDKPPQPDLPET